MARFGEVSRIVGGASRRTIRFAALGIVTVAVAGGTGWYLTRDTAAPEAVVETAQATRGTLATTVTLPGTASSTSSVALTFPVAGKIAEVNVVIGQTVNAVDPLARVDDTDSRQALQTAQNNLELARLKLSQLLSPAKPEDVQATRQTVVAAEAGVLNAQVALERLKRPPTASDISAADATVALRARVSRDGAALRGYVLRQSAGSAEYLLRAVGRDPPSSAMPFGGVPASARCDCTVAVDSGPAVCVTRDPRERNQRGSFGERCVR